MKLFFHRRLDRTAAPLAALSFLAGTVLAAWKLLTGDTSAALTFGLAGYAAAIIIILVALVLLALAYDGPRE